MKKITILSLIALTLLAPFAFGADVNPIRGTQVITGDLYLGGTLYNDALDVEQAARISATITNGVTTSSPSQDAVFDALALKAPVASPTFTGTTAFGIMTLPEKTPVNAVASSKLLSIGTAPIEAATVTIGGVAYKFTATVTDANDVLIGTVEESIDNLVLAVTAGAGEGTNYGTGTVTNPLATAVKASPTTMTATNKIKGVIGDLTAIAEGLADGSWAAGATFLSGGVDGTVGVANETCADASFIYHCPVANLISDNNWRRVTLGATY